MAKDIMKENCYAVYNILQVKKINIFKTYNKSVCRITSLIKTIDRNKRSIVSIKWFDLLEMGY